MILYTRYQCSACDNSKAFLTAQGVDYKIVNIMDDYAAAMTLVDAGIRSVPVLELESGERLLGAQEIKDHF